MSGPRYNKAFSSLGHECEMLADTDEIEAKIPGDSTWVKLKRRLVRSILVHEKICKSCAIHLRSHGAIEREKKRQLLYHPNSIHPFSSMRIFWEFFMIFISLSQLILVPFDVGYFHFKNTVPGVSSKLFVIIRMMLDLICCVDIIVNSMTGYYDESKKEIILSHGKIFINYLKTMFLMDFLSSVPTHWDLFTTLSYEATLAWQGISLFKIARYYTFNKYVTKLSNIFNVDFYIRQVVLMAFTLLLFWHILSSVQVYSYVIFKDNRNIGVYNNSTTFEALARALYDGSLIIYTASFGVEEPESNYEYLMTNLLWFISKFVQIYLLARVIEYLRAKTSPRMKYSQMVKQLMEFMRHKQLPLFTQRRILTYYEFHFQKSYFRENEIYATISGQLRQEIVMQTCRQLVENVQFFKDLPLNLLIRIVSCLKSEIYLTNDIVVKANTSGDCMYFISTGTVAVYSTSGKEICHLEDGAHFGEVALINADSKRVATVIAVEVCELYRLDRKDFVKAIHPYPDLLDKIQKIAFDRTEKTTMLDEHNKRELATKMLYQV